MHKELIFIGLGRMGAAMTARLVEQGFIVHGFDTHEATRQAAAGTGVQTYPTVTDTINAQTGRKVVWLMVPSTFVDLVLAEVYPQLSEGDIIIDGGNTFYTDTITRHTDAATKHIHYIDCGTSGGVNGARSGAALMVGGDATAIAAVDHIFHALAAPGGYAHVGSSGAGHFVKMVHNGIEYGMMGAIAEGMNFIEQHAQDLHLNPAAALGPYQHGSIISSSLMTWLATAYRTPGYLENIVGEVPKGETEAEMEFIMHQGQTPILAAAVAQRQSTRNTPSRIGTLISAMRNQFGGHHTISK